MKKNSYYFIVIFFLLLGACSQEDDAGDVVFNNTLAALVSETVFEEGTVIACASGSPNNNEVIVYVYPRPGVSDIRYFETSTADADASNFENYTEISLAEEDFFNGYLKKITRTMTQEKWVIVTFIDEGVVQLSNPIRLKHQSQNTVFTSQINIDTNEPNMPIFSWDEVVDANDEIYFQVVSDSQNNLLSGTYTVDSNFQYYELDNVVLNITRDTPPDLVPSETYNITVMGVSQDNWVNVFISEAFQN